MGGSVVARRRGRPGTLLEELLFLPALALALMRLVRGFHLGGRCGLNRGLGLGLNLRQCLSCLPLRRALLAAFILAAAPAAPMPLRLHLAIGRC
jgi:hypothetical protein